MRKKKNLLIILVVFLLLIVSSLVCINIFLDRFGKQSVRKALSGFTKREVKLGGLHYNPMQGLVLENLVINKYNSSEEFLSFKALTLKPSILALLFEKKLVFFGEAIPTKKFLLHILCSGDFNLNTKQLNINFKIKNLPYMEDLKGLNGTLKLNKNNLTIGVSSENVLLGGVAEIIEQSGKTVLRGNIKAPYILLKQAQIYNLYSDVLLQNDRLYISDLNCKLYNGNVMANANLDIADPKGAFNLNISLDEIDLESFSKNSTLAKKEIKGKLDAKFNLKGRLSDIKDTVGRGYFNIIDGDFWKTSIFKGISQIFYLPELESISFKEAHGTFFIADKNIKSNDARLISDRVTLASRGTLGFDGKIDVVIQAIFKEELIKKSKNFSKLTAILLDKAGQLIGELKISGTISKPRYSIVPISFDRIIQKVKDIFEGVLK